MVKREETNQDTNPIFGKSKIEQDNHKPPKRSHHFSCTSQFKDFLPPQGTKLEMLPRSGVLNAFPMSQSEN